MDHTMAVAAAETSAPAQAAAMPTAGGDAAAGRLVFRKCQACHSMEPGKTILGPSLAGIMGRKAGSDPGYNYSPAMKQANIVWDAKTLDAYLSDPQKLVPGNKMPFPGLKTDHDRADVIAYFAAPASAAWRRLPNNRRPQQQNKRRRRRTRHRKERPARMRVIRQTPNTPCDPVLPMDAWSISASGAPSTARSILC
jgi:cytochrome c2